MTCPGLFFSGVVEGELLVERDLLSVPRSSINVDDVEASSSCFVFLLFCSRRDLACVLGGMQAFELLRLWGITEADPVGGLEVGIPHHDDPVLLLGHLAEDLEVQWASSHCSRCIAYPWQSPPGEESSVFLWGTEALLVGLGFGLGLDFGFDGWRAGQLAGSLFDGAHDA